jgi:nucleoside-diphosphate-sugar epimerase
LRVVRCDLRDPVGFPNLLSGVDVVIHLAGLKRGNLEAHLSGTVEPTERLLEAMVNAGVGRLVLVSSLSVYDYRRLAPFSQLDEDSPIESQPDRREPYCTAKLLQEDLARRFQQRHGVRTTILRPGAIIGPAHVWTDQLGLRVGRWLWLRFTASGMPMQLTYVENCAAAIVLAAELDASSGGTFNVVDDDLPTRRQYARELRRRLPQRSLVLVLPGALVRSFGRGMWKLNELLFGGRLRLPWIANPAKLETQLKPLSFSHARITRVLGWEPRYSLCEALDRCAAGL